MLADECHKQGIKLFFYHSQLDWHHPDYYPRGRTGGGQPAGPRTANWNRYLDYMDGQLSELLTDYGPIGGIWFDGWWDKPEADWRLDRTYKLIHDLQPAALIGNNHHKRPFPGEDFQMFEKDLPGGRTAEFNKDAEIGALPLETCETMNNSWGFNLTDRRHKSTRELMHYLVKAAGHDANFLLNVGPMPERQDPARVHGAAEGDGPVDGEPRRVDLRHARRPGDPAAVGRHHPEGRHRLRPPPGLGRHRPLPPRSPPPREVGAPAQGRTPRRRAADRLWARPFPAAGRARSLRHRDRRRPGPQVTGRLAWTPLLAALGMAGGVESADLTEIKTRGALRVIIAADESADTFALTGGARPGFERDLMERFAQLHDLRLEVVRAPGYADRIPMLLRGEGDVIAAIFDTPDRREKVTFTAEVIPTHNVAVTLPPQAAITRVEDLRATKIGVIRGAKPGEAAAEAGVKPRDLVDYEKMDDLLRALEAREVGAAVLPISELALASKRVPGLKAGMTVGPPGTVAWAVRKEDAALRAAMDGYLANVRRSPSWGRLVIQYFGDQALAVLGRTR